MDPNNNPVLYNAIAALDAQFAALQQRIQGTFGLLSGKTATISGVTGPRGLQGRTGTTGR